MPYCAVVNIMLQNDFSDAFAMHHMLVNNCNALRGVYKLPIVAALLAIPKNILVVSSLGLLSWSLFGIFFDFWLFLWFFISRIVFFRLLGFFNVSPNDSHFLIKYLV